jgi:alpha-1,6-mannosyltransferase
MKAETIRPILLAALSLLFLGILVYFNYFLLRTDFTSLLLLFGGTFAIYLLLIFGKVNKVKHHFMVLMALAIVSRVAILFAIPNLSDDYFRFLWDGHLTINGISPFQYLPSEIIAQNLVDGDYALSLFAQMNSPEYYSVYPIINQFVFAMANLCFPSGIAGGVLVIKIFILGFEILTIYSLFLLTKIFKLSKNTVLLYTLNPLIIIEFCGNLHFEAGLIAFLLLSLYLLSQQKWALAAIPFAAAVLTKLHPLMLLPFVLKYLGWKKGILFSIIVAGITIGVFGGFMLPFKYPITQLNKLLTSIRLYFETFEFNGGIYYVLRAIGTSIYGYNPIQIVGKLLFFINLMGLLYIFWKQQKGFQALTKSIALAYLLYVLLSTTVHPWYILTLLPFSLLLRYKFALVWSGVIIITYFAYSTNDWHENFYLLMLEYTFVFVFLFYDFYRTKKPHEI